jgi:hypothetical protein
MRGVGADRAGARRLPRCVRPHARVSASSLPLARRRGLPPEVARVPPPAPADAPPPLTTREKKRGPGEGRPSGVLRMGNSRIEVGGVL